MQTRDATYRLLLVSSLSLLAACGQATDDAAADGPDAPVQQERHVGKEPRTGFGFVASEFLPIDEVEAALPLLARHDLDVELAWPATEIDNPRWYDVVRAAGAQGVQVQPWLTLSDAEGYFANSTNATLFAETLRRLAQRWLDEGIRPSIVHIDMEMPITRAREFMKVVASADVDALTAFMRAGIDRQQYAQATDVYRELVDWLHAQGFKVEVNVLPLVLDDYADGDDGLRQALQVPVDGIAWDHYAFQLHRTLVRYSFGEVAGPHNGYYVYNYARRAHAQFGDRAVVYLGLTDPGIAPEVPVYTGPDELREDVDAALLAGVSRDKIAIFSLRGLVHQPDPEQWFPPASRLLVPPLPDTATALTRASSLLLDSAL